MTWEEGAQSAECAWEEAGALAGVASRCGVMALVPGDKTGAEESSQSHWLSLVPPS